jgi:hypothetical protein
MIFKAFDVTKFCSTHRRFYIYIDDSKEIIYKKIKKKKHQEKIQKDFEEYKNIILDTNNENFCAIKGFDIEYNGSYKCKYIKGFTLYQILNNSHNREIIQEKLNIINAIENFKSEFNKTNITSGDWNFNNLIFCLNDKKIFNIDLEGYFTYKSSRGREPWGKDTLITRLDDLLNKLKLID